MTFEKLKSNSSYQKQWSDSPGYYSKKLSLQKLLVAEFPESEISKPWHMKSKLAAWLDTAGEKMCSERGRERTFYQTGNKCHTNPKLNRNHALEKQGKMKSTSTEYLKINIKSHW